MGYMHASNDQIQPKNKKSHRYLKIKDSNTQSLLENKRVDPHAIVESLRKSQLKLQAEKSEETLVAPPPGKSLAHYY